ncbi:MAG: flagellar hook-length control protein FliK [Pseudomonadota bacterium]
MLDNLPNGRHLVQVAGQKLDMGLPQSTRAGDSVRLTFMNAGPRPTFLLDQSPATAGQQVRISNTAQQVNALMRFASGAQPAAPQPAAPQPAPQAATQAAVQAAVPGAAASTPQATAAYEAAARIATPPRSTPSAAPGIAAAQVSAPAAARGMPAAAQTGGTVPPQAAVQSAQTAQTAQAAQTAAPARGTAAVAAGLAAQAGVSAAAGTRPVVANVVMLQAAQPSPLGMPTAVASATTGLLGQAVDGLRAAVPASTTLQPTVVADVAEPSSDLVPTRLAQTLRESGLFYEAHQARWVKGNYPFEALLSEPQARLGRGGMPMSGLAELGGMPEEAARLAGRQLHMLEGGPFLWQGFAWPGQWMEWLVEERQGWQGQGEEGEAADHWSTELRLTLPRMGTVHAQLSLRGHEVALRLHASEPGTIEILRAALPDLQQGLQGAGLKPAGLLVEAAP